MTQLSGLGALLHQEHLETLSVINDLEGRLSGAGAKTPMTANNPDDGALLRRILAMIANDADYHFAFEENVLFPMLDQIGFEQITTMLRGEHDVIRGLGEELRELAKRGLNGSLDTMTWKAFRVLAADLLNIEMFHIQKEEMGIISRLPILVDPATSATLAERYLAQPR